ncbi:butyrophilin-like protein 3 [Trichosurus vulpecula]|uniref:butyrophilin-like protein 3 n=1 Tax=Trichosurus vulpecula TaxID=9337 RepID=UPI00186B391C|nr:butyrophilin-like protein 3 [Trichosurus vulpecula]
MLNVPAFQCPSQVFHLFEYHLFFISILSVIGLGSAQFQVIGPDEHFQALVGEDVIFSCHVVPKMSLEDMEVRFFRNQFSSVLLLYKDGNEADEKQMEEYRGRIQFVQDAITEGTVSLKLNNITPSDKAIYGCGFISKTFSQQYTWELEVAALGSTPVISLEEYRDGGILLVCQSAGWLPQPNVQWRQDPGQRLSPNYTVEQDDHGFFSIKTTLTINEHSNKNISCSVLNLALKQEKESRVQVTDEFFQTSPWSIRFIVVMLLILALLGFIIFTYYNQGKRNEEGRVLQKSFYFSHKKKLDLKKKTKKAEWITATEHSVEVTLDPDTAHPKLRVSEDQKSVTYEDTNLPVFETEKRFEFPCIVASQSFSADKHYWEVEVGVMRNWFLGVCLDDVNRKERKIPFSPEKGYWILGMLNDYEYCIYHPTQKALTLSIQAHRIGVFLSYEDSEVSFFDATSRTHIYTFSKCNFRGKALYPYFCPSKNYDQELSIPMSLSPMLTFSSGDDTSQVNNNDVTSPQITQCLLSVIPHHLGKL